jgi:hypothetical protein
MGVWRLPQKWDYLREECPIKRRLFRASNGKAAGEPEGEDTVQMSDGKAFG